MGKEVFVKNGKGMVLFSPWRLTQSIMPTGIHPEKAYSIARQVGEHLKASGKRFVTGKDIGKLTKGYLEEIDPKLPEIYEIWREYKKRRASGKISEPMIVLIGGSTGSGKSSVALEVAHRLGIRNVIGTDYVRQVLRTLFSKDILPDLYLSTYNAYQAVNIPIAPGEDKVVIGYAEQAKHVAVGIEAIIGRAMAEGTDVILEGIHILPSILTDELLQNPTVNIVFLSMDSEEVHKERIKRRAEYSSRPVDSYMREFDKIRSIQNFIVEQGSSRSLPVIDNLDVDKSVEQIIKKVTINVQSLIKKNGSGNK